ncbi:O-antigen ligase family protein [Myxococcota bacterium]
MNFAMVTSVFLYLEIKSTAKKAVLVSTAIVVMIIFIGAIGNIFYETISYFHSIAPDTVNSRISQYSSSISEILRNPLFGYSDDKSLQLYHFGTMIHNFFLRTGFEYGVFGTAIMLFIYLNVIYRLYITHRALSGHERSICSCIIAGFVGINVELFLYPGLEKQMWFYIGLQTVFLSAYFRHSQSLKPVKTEETECITVGEAAASQ